MDKKVCSHTWEMINVVPSYIVTEKCFHCNQIAAYKTRENPPLEKYKDGDHLWNVVETAQSFNFALKCKDCDHIENFDELLGLMMCPWCDEPCKIGDMVKELIPQKTWVYIAIGNLPVENNKQISEEKMEILENYYNQKRMSKSKIKIVSHKLIGKLELCKAEVIKDIDMTSLTKPE